MTRSTLLLLAGSALLLPSSLSAQVAVAFPHGSFPEGLECLDCHTNEGWSPIRENPGFDHGDLTGFPLVGRHASAPCRSCHQDLHFEKADASGEECGTCHLDIHSGSLPANCALCHTPSSFQDVSGIRIHQTTGFLLEGAHLQITCESCHSTDEGGSFSPRSTECLACHQEEYEAPKAADHVALGFPGECLTCHTPRAWMDIGAFDHAEFSNGFELLGAHAQAQCSDCHAPGGGLLFNPSGQGDCAACHQADYQREHAGSGIPQTCGLCHNQENWDRESFDHTAASGGFTLSGPHEALACTNCHTPDGTSALYHPEGPGDCVSCHQADFQRGHAGLGYPVTCLSCHSPNRWEGAVADHVVLSNGFELLGDHAELACGSCHTPDGSATLFTPTAPDDCVSCHQADFQEEHSGQGYPSTCLDCHSLNSWDGAVADHVALSDGFELLGDHAELACGSCHTPDGSATLFTPTAPDDCVSCHQADFQEEHSGQGYPSTCLDCHSLNSWDGAVADHLVLSNGFGLLGNHGLLPCTSCHVPGGTEGLFNPTTPEDCLACHQADYQQEHAGSNYPTTCLTCHQVTTWDGAVVDHAQISGGFALPSDHGTLACSSCHTPDGSGTLFQPSSPDDCVSCHQADYQREHSGSGYPESCALCHTTAGWDGATADHTALSGGFGLLGDHGLLPCTSCHVPGGTEGLFNPTTPEDCLACHQADYQQEHAGSNYPTTCLTCHQVTTWDGPVVDHAVVSGGFALPSDHEALACTNCHTPDGSGTLFQPNSPDDCVSCHQADYQREHSGSGYSTTCSLCHTTAGWDGLSADHETLSGGFELLGNHKLLACSSCHTPDGTGTLFQPSAPDDCLACHQADFQREHSGSGYPTTCLSCHTVDSWDGASGDHVVLSGGFELVGNHDQLTCESCHIVPGMATLFTPSNPEDCLACHQGDFQREHSGDQYPTTCLTCHQVTTWGGAQFNHDGDYFRINSGTHRGKWTSCQTCHTTPGDYSQFTCLDCHQHNKADTDSHHREVSGYAYQSGQCLSCHPRANP